MPSDSPRSLDLAIARPGFAVWLYARAISRETAAAALGLAPVTIHRYCLPFGHAERRIPGEDILARIRDWTGGAVTPAQFYDPASANVPERAAAA